MVLAGVIRSAIQLQMFRRDQPLTDKMLEPARAQPNQDNSYQKVKISNLAPYLTEIQRRKKQRHEQRSKKLTHDSSSKSFRIKEKSVASLQKELIKRPHVPTKPLAKHNEHSLKQRRTQSVHRHHEFQLSRTIDSKNQIKEESSTAFFNQLYAKMKSRMEKSGKDRKRKQFQTLEEQRSRSEQEGDLNMYKINLTNKAETRPTVISKSEKVTQATAQPTRKKNFRRNKYQMDSGELTEKKEENYTQMNIEMDRLAAYQNQAFVKARSRQLHGSIERSTEKYLNYESYRRPSRSKNQIEIYVSGLANPSVQKVSKSTNEQSHSKNRFQLANSLKPSQTPSSCLEYDFDFQNQEEKKGVEQKAEEQQEVVGDFVLKEQDEFQKQRRKVEIEFFNKAEPQLDWSEDQCKVDDI